MVFLVLGANLKRHMLNLLRDLCYNLEAMANKQKVAFFDIDGTIFRSSLLIELTESLIQEKIFPQEARKIYAGAFKRWLDRKDTYDKYIWAVIRAYNKYIAGVEYAKFERVAEQVVSFHKNRVYRYTRDLIKDLKKKKYYLVAISNSPKEIVEVFAKSLGFNKIYGRIYKITDEGRFENKVLFLDLVNDKSKVVEWAVKTEGLSLKGSVGIGDSESDIPLLGMVERPICFNPNSKLYAYAKRKKWEVVVERKDVVYHL